MTYSEEYYWQQCLVHYQASQEFFDYIATQLELLCSLCMAGLVVALGACIYYLFWKRRR